MIPGKPSQTAEFVAILRANHFLNTKEPKLLHDSLALVMTSYSTPEEIDAHVQGIIGVFANLSDQKSAEIFVKRIEQAVCIRARLVEERLKVLRDQGLAQFVILGAGMDTSAYRLPNLLDGIAVFEVDHPDTQNWKKEKLKASKIEIPDNISFVPYDFENQTLMEALRDGGISHAQKSLFPWLGVNMYLTKDAVQDTLSTVTEFAAGSELIMDFAMPDYDHNFDVMPNSIDKLAKVVADMGEPMLSKFTLGELANVFSEAGFSEFTFYDGPMVVNEVLHGNATNFEFPPEAVTMARAVI